MVDWHLPGSGGHRPGAHYVCRGSASAPERMAHVRRDRRLHFQRQPNSLRRILGIFFQSSRFVGSKKSLFGVHDGRGAFSVGLCSVCSGLLFGPHSLRLGGIVSGWLLHHWANAPLRSLRHCPKRHGHGFLYCEHLGWLRHVAFNKWACLAPRRL